MLQTDSGAKSLMLLGGDLQIAKVRDEETILEKYHWWRNVALETGNWKLPSKQDRICMRYVMGKDGRELRKCENIKLSEGSDISKLALRINPFFLGRPRVRRKYHEAFQPPYVMRTEDREQGSIWTTRYGPLSFDLKLCISHEIHLPCRASTERLNSDTINRRNFSGLHFRRKIRSSPLRRPYLRLLENWKVLIFMRATTYYATSHAKTIFLQIFCFHSSEWATWGKLHEELRNKTGTRCQYFYIIQCEAFFDWRAGLSR